LAQQTLVAFPRDKLPLLVERYYALDDVVVREIVGKQRLTKSRKDLDEIATASGVHLKSVTRQFDTLKRVYLATEEFCAGSVHKFVSERYQLPMELARRYACLVFLVSCGFALGAKKRMLRVSCSGLERCAALTMACLVTDLATFSSCCDLSSVEDGQEETQPLGTTREEVWAKVYKCVRSVPNAEGVDKQLQQDLSRVRVALSQQRYEPGLIRIQASMTMTAEWEGGVTLPLVTKDVLRDLVNIGSQLSQTREYRDLFEDILTKVGEPLEEAGWSRAQINAFLIGCTYFLDALSEESMRERRSSSSSVSVQALDRSSTIDARTISEK
jgi:hypothetical protein